MPKRDVAPLAVLPPDASPELIRATARNDAWNLRLNGLDQEAIARELNKRYNLTHPKDLLTPRKVQQLLDTTMRSKRVLHDQDAGDRALLAEARMERVLENVWSEIDFERSLRDRWLEGEFDGRAEVSESGIAIVGQKDPRFSIHTLLKEARETVKDLAKMQGVLGPEVANNITINHQHLEVLIGELASDPETAGLAAYIAEQKRLIEQAGDDASGLDRAGDPGQAGEERVIDGEYFPSRESGETLADGPEALPEGVLRDAPDPGPGAHLR